MRKKKIALLIMTLTMTTSLLGGCSGKDKQDTPNITSSVSATVSESSEPTSETVEASKETVEPTPEETESVDIRETKNTEKKDSFSFQDISNLEFYYGSGVGAWCTTLEVRKDGSFIGNYHDADMGDTGEGYPDGKWYTSSFEGQFSEPKKVNDYTYSVKIDNIKLENKEDTEEIKDGIKYIYTKPYGLEGAKDILFYLPGAPIKELPESFVSWMMTIELPKGDDAKLPFYGLYNEKTGDGFSSYEAVSGYPIYDDLKEVEADAAKLDKKLKTEDLTQTEMNEISKQIYQIWDDELNAIWGLLKKELDPDDMKKLTKEEKEWIANKEKEVKKVSDEYDGGSIRPMMMTTKAAELTKKRVYELAAYVPK